MKKATSEQLSEFVIFASPCYWLLALMVIALAIWKVGFHEPDLLSLAWVSIAIIVAAIFLVKRYYWISFPMVLLGVYIFYALQHDQHFGHIFQLYGAYLILHYSACFIYVFKNRKKSS